MSPECKRIRPLLSPYFDGETDDNETQLVRQHLPGCPDCQAELDDYRLIRTQFSRTRHPSAPPELRRAVLAEVHAVRTGTARQRGFGLNPALRFAPLIGGIATIAVAVILLVIALGNNNKPTVEVADVMPAADGSALVTFNQSINSDVLEKNPDLLQITDAKGKKIEADVKKIDDKTIRLMPKQSEITAPDEPIKVTANNKNGNQPPIVAALPPQPTATLTRAPATPTTRSAQTSQAAQTTVANNPTTAAGATATPLRTTAAVTTAAAVTPVPVATPTVTAGTTVTPTVGATTTVTTTIGPTVTGSPGVTTTTTVTPTVATTPTAGTTTSPTAETSCAISPIRGFGKVYKEQTNLAQSLGCPIEQERQATLAYQAFNGGTMLYDQRSNRIYVMYKSNSRFESFSNTFQEGEPTPAPVTAPACSTPPGRGFGKIWFSNPSVRQVLGCPLAPENSSSLAATESYERGAMYSYPTATNGKRIYVLLNNGNYFDLADTFAG